MVVDPADYGRIGAALAANGGALPLSLRFELAQQAFQHTAAYDAEIARYLAGRLESAATAGLPARLDLPLEKSADLRYGENPHQKAALYRLAGSGERGIATAEQLQGKELSYNNLLDSDAAWELVLEIHRMHLAEARAAGAITPHDLPVTCAIIKHSRA